MFSQVTRSTRTLLARPVLGAAGRGSGGTSAQLSSVITNGSRAGQWPAGGEFFLGFPSVPSRDDQQKRHLHATAKNEVTSIALGAIGVGAAALGAKYVVEAWTEYQARPKSEKAESSSSSGPSSWFGSRNFYSGGFEPEMTRREAALILGLR